MKAWIPATLVIALGFAAHAQAACVYPKSPDTPPDGNTATKEQMTDAAKDTKRYNDEMNMYLDCLKLEAQNAVPPKNTKLSAEDKKKADEQAAMYAQKNNAAVDELQAVVARFNEQLKIYKAKNAKS